MAKKKKQSGQEEVPVDRVEAFLERNFRKIMISIGGVIVLFIAVYAVFTVIQSNKEQKISRIGQYEHVLEADNSSPSAINEFLQFGQSIDSIADYSRYRAANLYLSIGRTDKAVDLLNSVEEPYTELADSVLYDLGENINIQKYNEQSYLKQIWDYRRMLESGYNSDDIKQFAETYPDSRLLELLKNWK